MHIIFGIILLVVGILLSIVVLILTIDILVYLLGNKEITMTNDFIHKHFI